MIENYLIYLLTGILIFLILAIYQNITLGNLGLLSLGNMAFFAIGSYTYAILSKLDFSLYLALFLAGIFGLLVSLFMTIILKNIDGDYYALGTLAFFFVIQNILLNFTSLTEGALGIKGIIKPDFFGFELNSLFSFFIFILFFSIIVLIFTYFFLKSDFNLIMSSVRDNKLFSNTIGINDFYIKLKTMGLVGFISGIFGAFYSMYLTYIDPFVFSLPLIILIFTIVILGGIASFKGSIISAFLIILIPEILRFFPIDSINIGAFREIIYALILIGIIFYKPKGFFGKVEVG